MTVNELIEVLKKFDGNLEVVNPEDVTVGSIDESDFEVDNHYKALVFKAAGDMPSNSDWEQSYWWNHHR